jgi:nitroreductase
VDALEAIRSRRNVRKFADRPIPQADLDEILEAARRTPSSRNEQRWDFVVCTDRAQLEDLALVWRGAGHVATSAATMALIAPETDDVDLMGSIEYDLGQATMSIMIAAAALGVGSAHAAARDQEQARKVLGFPEDRRCAWLVALGYPADRPLAPIRRPSRRAFDDVVHRGGW